MKRPRLRWLRRAVTILIFLAVLEYLVLPQIAGTRNALHVISNVQPLWLIVGVALEALSLVSFSLLTRSVLPDKRPTFSWIFRTDLTSLGVSHVVPGGAATASTLRYHLLHQGGTPPEDAIVGAAFEGIGSTLVLIAILFCGIVLSLPLGGIQPAYISAAGVGAAIIALAVIAAWGLVGGNAWSRAVTRRMIGWLPQRLQGRAAKALRDAADQLAQLLADKPRLRRCAVWGTGNWLLDAASLWVFLAAFGWRANPIGLLVGYGLANVLAGLPISPGGLGIVEGVLIPSLVGFGAPRGEAVLGVVAWRLFEFWAPIPVAALCYLSLRTEERRSLQEIRRRWAEFRALFGQPPRVGGAGPIEPDRIDRTDLTGRTGRTDAGDRPSARTRTSK